MLTIAPKKLKKINNMKKRSIYKGDNMNIEKNYNEKELTIKVYNQIDTVTAPDFQNEIFDEMGKFNSLILDFEKLEYISSAGLRILILTQKKLQPEGIPFKIINTPDFIKDIITTSGLDNIIRME